MLHHAPALPWTSLWRDLTTPAEIVNTTRSERQESELGCSALPLDLWGSRTLRSVRTHLLRRLYRYSRRLRSFLSTAREHKHVISPCAVGHGPRALHRRLVATTRGSANACASQAQPSHVFPASPLSPSTYSTSMKFVLFASSMSIFLPIRSSWMKDPVVEKVMESSPTQRLPDMGDLENLFPSSCRS